MITNGTTPFGSVHWPEAAQSAAPPLHAVHFYESEDVLFEAVGGFFAEALKASYPAIMIAAEAHRDGVLKILKDRGLDADKIVFADAREMLGRVMAGPMPDERAFKLHVGELIAKTAGGGPPAVRVYGEMVDLLWRDGNPEAAIRLEELWNDLVRDDSFSLLCAYPMGNFYKEAFCDAFDRVCDSHSGMVPSRDVAMLRQRAGALAAEVEHRKELENALRDALAARRQGDDANAFLLDATSVLYRSLDTGTRFGELARLIVPRLADWCAIDVLRDDGSFERAGSAGDTAHRPADAAILAAMRGGETGDDSAASSQMIVPMRHTAGVLGAISFVTNGAQRRYGDADRALATELARRAAVAVDHARLYHYAQQANRAKDEFLAKLSHELRTPLTAILGWARMLRLGIDDSETFNLALETIERSARAQATLIDDILDLSKVASGKIAMESERVDLTNIVNNAVDTVRLAANAKRIDLDFVHPPQPAFVDGDPMRLQQVVWNLLSNAIKFSNAGGTVRVELKRTPAVARVVVRDEGLGIRRDFLPHVFEPFRQAEASTARASGGLGLGLAIVKSITEMHGGSIVVESAGEGSGATFTVALPLASPRPSDAAASAPDLAGMSVLVVEGDDDTRIVIGAALRNCGAEVRSASSVGQACQLVDQKAPDVLVADVAMPHEDGLALVEHLHARQAPLREIPVIAVTAFGLPADEQRILGAGFHVYVRKPVEPLHFAGLVAQFKK